jgi:Planctomycete cytochrome C
MRLCSIGPVARLTLAGVSRVIALCAIAIAPACTALEPETGDRLRACVDVDSSPETVSFKGKIRPLIDGRTPGPKPCKNCHYRNDGTHEGVDTSGLDLETLPAIKKGGNNTAGITVIPGKPCESAIIQKIRGTFGGARMPKGGPYWTPEQVQLFMDWISEGAVEDE